jgi:hypothetical protein
MLRYLREGMRTLFEASTGDLTPEARDRSEIDQDALFDVRHGLLVGLGNAVLAEEPLIPEPMVPQRPRPLAAELGHSSIISTEEDVLGRAPLPENTLPNGHEAYLGAITTDKQTPIVQDPQYDAGLDVGNVVVQGPWPTPAEQSFIQPGQKVA